MTIICYPGDESENEKFLKFVFSCFSLFLRFKGIFIRMKIMIDSLNGRNIWILVLNYLYTGFNHPDTHLIPISNQNRLAGKILRVFKSRFDARILSGYRIGYLFPHLNCLINEPSISVTMTLPAASSVPPRRYIKFTESDNSQMPCGDTICELHLI